MNIVGLDLSLRAPGISMEHQTWTEKGFGDLKGPQRLKAYRDFFTTAFDSVVDVAIIEGYSPGSKFKREALGELGGVVQLLLFDLGITTVIVQPKSLKKYATGKGNADKFAMHAALHKRATDLELSDDNSVDAWWLRQMGLQRYESHRAVPVPQLQYEALLAVEWPDLAVKAAS